MSETRTTIYISSESNQRAERVVADLEAQHVVGLRHSDGTINTSALLSYLLKYAEKTLKIAEK